MRTGKKLVVNSGRERGRPNAMRHSGEGSTSAVLEFEMYKDLRCTKLGCDYRKGVFTSIPLTFGRKQPASLKHPQCQATGASKEVYELAWD